MSENKRFISSGNWIKDNNIDRLLNIDFNTIADRNMCCKLLNRLEDKKSEYIERIDEYFEENKQLKKENKQLKDFLEGNCILCGANLSLLYKKKYGDSE